MENEELQNKINELEEEIKLLRKLTETHVHSGNETINIERILRNKMDVEMSGDYFKLGAPTYFKKSINLIPQSSHTYIAGDIINWAEGATDQFRGRPGDGTWDGSFDMTAI